MHHPTDSSPISGASSAATTLGQPKGIEVQIPRFQVAQTVESLPTPEEDFVASSATSTIFQPRGKKQHKDKSSIIRNVREEEKGEGIEVRIPRFKVARTAESLPMDSKNAFSRI